MNEFLAFFEAGGTVNVVLKAVITIVAGVLAIKLLLKGVETALERSRLEKAAHGLISSIIKAVLYVLLGLAVASGLGIDVTGVVALASVLTLAVSLSLQNMLTNVIGGLTLLTTKPFHSGDFVEIGGQAGTVEEINMTYTRLVTPDNKVISLPNSSVVSAQVVNFSANPIRRVDFEVSVSYDAPTETAIAALIAAGTVEKTLADPAPFAAVSRYDSSNVTYTLRTWVKAEDYWDVFFEVNNRLKPMLEQQGVTMSYPHVNVHLDK